MPFVPIWCWIIRPAYPEFIVAIVVPLSKMSALGWNDIALVCAASKNNPGLFEGKHLVSAMSVVTPLEDLMHVLENGNGNTLSFRLSAKFKRSDKYPTNPPVHIRLVSSSHCRTASFHHGSRILSPMEPRIPSEIPDPALDSALGRRTPPPQGILASQVKQNAL